MSVPTPQAATNPAARTAGLRTRLVSGALPRELEALAARPEGSFFQSPAWMRAVALAEPRLRPGALVAETAHGDVRGAVPFFVVSKLGMRRIYAGAWGTYGGVLAVDAAAARTLHDALVALATSPRTALFRVHDFAATLADGPWLPIVESCQVLDLPADPEALFRDAFTMQNRNKIRKAEKGGVSVRLAADAASLAAYAAMYAESAARWKLDRPLPAHFFAALAGAPGTQVWLAEQAGRPVAALLNFALGGQIMNWGNVSRREAWRLAPNNLLHWRALEAACRDAEGPRLYNFGGSTGLPGVETFKASFGASLREVMRRERVARWARWVAGSAKPIAPVVTDVAEE